MVGLRLVLLLPVWDPAIGTGWRVRWRANENVVDVADCYVQKVKFTLEISALPKDLPKEITVDISSIKTIQDVLHVSDLVIPK